MLVCKGSGFPSMIVCKGSGFPSMIVCKDSGFPSMFIAYTIGTAYVHAYFILYSLMSLRVLVSRDLLLDSTMNLAKLLELQPLSSVSLHHS